MSTANHNRGPPPTVADRSRSATARRCYNRGMRFKTGLLVGLAAGYYLGAKAGRERYFQIEEQLDRLREQPAYQQARARLDDTFGDVTRNARAVLDDALDGAPGRRAAERAGSDDVDLPSDWVDEAFLDDRTAGPRH